MNFVDIIFIFIVICSIYVGYNGGFYRILSDTLTFFVVCILSGLLTNVLFDKVITYLPFFNLWGASEGIKSINIIMWRVILYILLLILLALIINKILAKTGIEEKLDEKVITMKKWGRYLGGLLIIPFMMIVLFNVILILGMPIFNLSSIHESWSAKFLTNNMIIIKDTTKSLYSSEVYATKKINSSNTISTYENINNDIINYLDDNKLISSENINILRKNNKIYGVKTKNIDNQDNSNTTIDIDESKK